MTERIRRGITRKVISRVLGNVKDYKYDFTKHQERKGKLKKLGTFK